MDDSDLRGPRPSEGVHWYTRDAKPVYEVPSADGKRMIEPDIRHARKLGLLPGQSAIVRCAAAPQLVNWKIDQAVLSALTATRRVSESDKDFIARVLKDGREGADRARERGTEIHAAIQGYFDSLAIVGQPEIALSLTPEDMRPFVAGAANRLFQATGEAMWRSEKVVVHRSGYGTKADLIANGWLVDIKSKDGDENSLHQELLYDEHYMQLASTRQAIEPTAVHPCGILFVSRTHPGAAVLKVSEEKKLRIALRMFASLLDFWKAKNDHDPSW